MKRIHVTIAGSYALLLDAFGDHAAEQVSRGTSQVISSKKQLEPRQEAERRLYIDSTGRCVFPGANLFSALVQAGVFIKLGRKALTTTQSSLVPACVQVCELEVPILRPDGTDAKWEVERRSVVNRVTSARIMSSRPRFDVWALSFTLETDDTMIADDTVRQLVDYAGQRIGIGVFRPAKKGPFGRFKVTHWTVEKQDPAPDKIHPAPPTRKRASVKEAAAQE